MNAIKFLFSSLARLPPSAELKRILLGNEAAGAICYQIDGIYLLLASSKFDQPKLSMNNQPGDWNQSSETAKYFQ